MSNPSQPYTHLDPDLIFQAIDSLGFRCDGCLFALNSYENRVYQVGVEDAAPLIVKFYRPGRWCPEAILEEHEFALELVSHEIPIVPPLRIQGHTLHQYQNFSFALFPRQGGRPLELDNSEHLEWVGRFIGRMHSIGACKSFQHRICLDVETYGMRPYQFLLEYQFIPDEIKHNYCHTIDILLKLIADCFQRVEGLQYIRLHGDCHSGNILWNAGGPYIVDLDDCLMGPAIQDMWMLLSGGSSHDTKTQLNHILKGYHEFYDFNFREISLIEALRTLRMIHYAGWLAKRWEDPAFPLNFPWFNTPRYWQEHLQHLREQVPLLSLE